MTRLNTICLLLRDQPSPQVLLGLKKQGFGLGKYLAVGGHVEKGETVRAATLRELHEEIGITARAADLQYAGKLNFTFPANPDWDRLVHVYLLRRWEGQPAESDEINPFWFSFDQLPHDEMWPDGAEWLPRVLAGERLLGDFTYQDDNATLKDHTIKPMKNFLRLHLEGLPYFRSLLRTVEAEYYQDLDFPEPVYDVGCGDGHFASLALDFKIDAGLDPWEEPIREAPGHGAYKGLVVADGAQTPFPSAHFGSALSNSVLEHIEHIDEVLVETGRVLKPGAAFVFCVPNPRYYTYLAVPAWLRKLGLKSLAHRYIDWFGRMSRVFHADWPETWQARLEMAGFRLEHWWHYFPQRSMRALEIGHYFGLPSLVSRWLTGRWILAPARWNLALTERLVRKYALTDWREDGAFTFFIARKA